MRNPENTYELLPSRSFSYYETLWLLRLFSATYCLLINGNINWTCRLYTKTNYHINIYNY